MVSAHRGRRSRRRSCRSPGRPDERHVLAGASIRKPSPEQPRATFDTNVCPPPSSSEPGRVRDRTAVGRRVPLRVDPDTFDEGPALRTQRELVPLEPEAFVEGLGADALVFERLGDLVSVREGVGAAVARRREARVRAAAALFLVQVAGGAGPVPEAGDEAVVGGLLRGGRARRLGRLIRAGAIAVRAASAQTVGIARHETSRPASALRTWFFETRSPEPRASIPTPPQAERRFRSTVAPSPSTRAHAAATPATVLRASEAPGPRTRSAAPFVRATRFLSSAASAPSTTIRRLRRSARSTRSRRGDRRRRRCRRRRAAFDADAAQRDAVGPVLDPDPDERGGPHAELLDRDVVGVDRERGRDDGGCRSWCTPERRRPRRRTGRRPHPSRSRTWRAERGRRSVCPGRVAAQLDAEPLARRDVDARGVAGARGVAARRAKRRRRAAGCRASRRPRSPRSRPSRRSRRRRWPRCRRRPGSCRTGWPCCRSRLRRASCRPPSPCTVAAPAAPAPGSPRGRIAPEPDASPLIAPPSR